MDVITYALCRKMAAAAVSGISDIAVRGTDLVITTKSGNVLTMSFPTPADGISVTSLEINEESHLICTLSDGSTIDAGYIKQGIDGKDGINGISLTKVEIDENSHLICTLSDNSKLDAGEIIQGKDGISVSNIKIDEDNHLICELSDGSTIDAGALFSVGVDGISITNVQVNENNHLICTLSDGNEIDAGKITTLQGKDGRSAYELAVAAGYTGTLEQWLESLKGVSIGTLTINEDDELIYTLSDGTIGSAGKMPSDTILNLQDVAIQSIEITENGELKFILSDGTIITTDPVEGIKGTDGLSITAVRIIDGHLHCLMSDGSDVDAGEVPRGDILNLEGVSISNISMNESNSLIFTLSDGTSINAGQMPQGPKGENGKSAYEIAVAAGFEGTEQEWLESLKGKDGLEGVTAEQIPFDETGTGLGVNNVQAAIETIVEKINQIGNGQDGVSISNIKIDENNRLICELSDGTIIDAGEVSAETIINLDGVSISNIEINEAGHLIFTFSDGTVADAGEVVGLKGDKGDNGISVTSLEINAEDHLICTLSDGSTIDAGQVPADTILNLDGVSISNIEVNKDGGLDFVFSDGSHIVTEPIKGIKGENGDDGVSIVKVEVRDRDLICTLSDGLEINAGEIVGKDGKSAYDIAVDNGFSGTEQEWLESLKGAGAGGGILQVASYSDLPATGNTTILYIVLDTGTTYYYTEASGYVKLTAAADEHDYATKTDIDNLFNDDGTIFPDVDNYEIATEADIDNLFADDGEIIIPESKLEYATETDIDNLFKDDGDVIVPDSSFDIATKEDIDTLFGNEEILPEDSNFSLATESDIDSLFKEEEV